MALKLKVKIGGFALFGVSFIMFSILLADWIISSQTSNYIFDNASKIPPNKVVLVLGTSRNLKGGAPNPYFYNRIQAAKELFDAGKVKAFILSGDNSRETYNEPDDMRNALIAKGIPDSIIYLDYAGLRTLDSVIRLNKVFGQNSCIVVSQKFHNERAVYIARHYGIEAYGYNASDVKLGRVSYKTKIREKFARVKVFVDLIMDKQPKYLGDPISIN